jgi:hypothetical protein
VRGLCVSTRQSPPVCQRACITRTSLKKATKGFQRACLRPRYSLLRLFAPAIGTATVSPGLSTRLAVQTASSRRLQTGMDKPHHHQSGVSQRCGGHAAPHKMPRLAMLARDAFFLSRHSSFHCRCTSQGNIEQLFAHFEFGYCGAWPLCVDLPCATCVSIRACAEHESEEGN